jgi:hypothetical protein
MSVAGVGDGIGHFDIIKRGRPPRDSRKPVMLFALRERLTDNTGLHAETVSDVAFRV